MLAAARRCFFSIQFHGESLGLCVGGAFAFFQFDMAGGGRDGLLLFFLFFFFKNRFKGRKQGLGCAGGGFFFNSIREARPWAVALASLFFFQFQNGWVCLLEER